MGQAARDRTLEEHVSATAGRNPASGEDDSRTAVLRRARQRLRRTQALLAHSSDILFIVDPAGNPIYVSPAAGRILGYAQDRPLGQSTLDLLHPDDVPQTAEALAHVMSGGAEDECVVVRTRTADGDYRFLELRARSLLDDPDVEGVLVSARDVTAQKQAEENLRSSEHRFCSIVRSSSDMIVVVDVGATITYVSPASQVMLGRSETDMIGVGILDFIHPDDATAAAEGFARTVAAEGHHAPISLRALHTDGHWVHVEAMSNNLLDDPDVRGIVVNVRDVTERLRMNAELAEAQRRLIDSFEQAAVGLALLDTKGRYTRLNRALCEMLGYSEHELLGRSFEAVTYPDDVARVLDRHDEETASGHDTYHSEKRYVHRDGHPLWASVDITMVRDVEGRPDYYLSQVIDITERKKLQQQLAHDAVHDSLTGLPTRPLLFDRLDQALATARRGRLQVAVLFVDLDDFKLVNDSLGHVAGDKVLVQAAQRLREAVREVDTPARFGGDEFVVICPGLTGIADAVGIAERIRSTLVTPIRAAGTEIRLDASVGIAIADGNAAGDDLLSEADSAAYGAKRRGGGAWELAATLNGQAAQ